MLNFQGLLYFNGIVFAKNILELLYQRVDLIMKFTTIATLVGSLFLFSFSSFNRHISKRYSIHGIDISHHQKNINWDNIVNHDEFKVSFCFLKATEGGNFKDTMFKEYWRKCKEAGIVRGAYHFYNPAKGYAEQANNFIRTVDLTENDLAPVLDFEKDVTTASVAQVRYSLRRWLEVVENHYGVKPIIYTNPFIYNKYIKGYFKNNPLWIADYNSSYIHNFLSHPNLKFWQYTEKGRVSGINGHVDVNAFMGEEEEFDNLKVGS